MVALTVPSIPFSMGTKPRRDLTPGDGIEHGGDGREGGADRAAARSGWVSSASCVKVAAGPK